MSYHMTNSSHAIDHFLLLEIALNAGSVVLEGTATRRGGVLSCGNRMPSRRAVRSAAAYPGRTHGMLAHFMVRLYIAVVCKWQPTVLSYGEALADRIVSYRIAIFCPISYCIYRFLLWLYRAITRPRWWSPWPWGPSPWPWPWSWRPSPWPCKPWLQLRLPVLQLVSLTQLSKSVTTKLWLSGYCFLLCIQTAL